MSKRILIWRTTLLVAAVAVATLVAHWYVARPRYVWDFTRSRSADFLGIPKRMHPFDSFYHLDVNGRVVAHLAPGHTLDDRVTVVAFRQYTPGTIAGVAFNLEPQTAEDLFATAERLAREWNLPMDPLLDWQRATALGRIEYAQTIRNDLRPTIAVEIFKSYRHDKPFFIMLDVGWPNREKAATEP